MVAGRETRAGLEVVTVTQSDEDFSSLLAMAARRAMPRFENVAISEPTALREWAQKEKNCFDRSRARRAAGRRFGLTSSVDMILRVFGPTQAAAQLESSKAFSKAFMQRHGIPTAEFETFSDAALAHAYIDQRGRAHCGQGGWSGRWQGGGCGHDCAASP